MAAVPFEPGEKLFECDGERVGAGFGEEIRHFGVVFDAAELTDVVKDESAVVEFEDGAGIFGAFAIPEKLAGHTEVDVQNATVELHEDLLAAPAYALNFFASERFCSGGPWGASHAVGGELDVLDGVPGDVRRNGADDGFNFGEFGHGVCSILVGRNDEDRCCRVALTRFGFEKRRRGGALSDNGPMIHGLLPFLLGVALLQGQDGAVKVHQEMRTFPTYDEGDPDANPQFEAFYRNIFPNYPYTIRNPINKNRTLKEWRIIVLENEYLSCRILPDLGGHLHGCTDKITGKEIFFSNPAIRPTEDSKRKGYIATGIESSFPMAHGRVTGSPVDFAWDVRDGIGRVVVEDTDRTSGMQWRVEFIQRPGVATLEQRATLYNGSVARRGYHWWVNAAVELDDPHLRIVYPVKWMIPHGEGSMTSWPIAGGVDLSDVANYKTQTGLFAHLSREPWMALYKPQFRSGLAHYANVSSVRGKKIWVWGKERTGDDYVKQNLTENSNSYVEMQAGELESQPEFTFLLPGQSKTFVHYWIPFHDLGGIARATPDAVLNLDRSGNSVKVELQGTHLMKGLTLRLSDGGKLVWQGVVDLGPRVKYVRPVEAEKLTVDLMGVGGKVLLHQVENEYDSTPFDSQAANPEPTVPGGESDAEPDALARGAYNEERDSWVLAWGDYQRALQIKPDSEKLKLAAGRAAIVLNRYDDAIELLKDRASSNAEAAYYYGVALASKSSRVAEAQSVLARAAKDATYANAANLQMALLSARERGTDGKIEAARILQLLAAKPGAAPHLGALEVALLRQIGKADEAKSRLKFWLRQDPADSMLEVEQVLNGGADDSTLWNHLAADPERLLRAAVDYRNTGDCADAVTLLERRYAAQPDTEKEPGKTLPQDHPLVAYYRGYCRLTLGQDARADFQSGSKLSTRYVFPHLEFDYRVLEAARAQNDGDAVAHDLLGDLYFDSFRVTEAIAEWRKAQALKNDLPALHRNLGLALLNFANDPVAAQPVLLEGRRLAPDDWEIGNALHRIESASPNPPAKR